MNSTNNDSYEMAAAKVFCDLYALIKENEKTIDDKPFKFDLSKMSSDIISCIGNQLEDYPFKIYDDTELYNYFLNMINQMFIKNISNILVILKII